MTHYLTQAGREFLEEGKIGDVVKKVGSTLSKVRKSIFRTKGEKAASKAKLKAHMDASDAQTAKSTADREDKEKAPAAATTTGGEGTTKREPRVRKNYTRAEAWHAAR
tara:strand:- start:76 stop:399 length:324 start_codon:yes stop_codon:yes gene_type:complete